MQRVIPAAILAVFTSISLAQDVPCEKYRLPNGMTVILHEDHALPIATVNTWYRVGAQDEPPGRSGFAHLFEHLMFMGTRRAPGNQFDTLMEAGGGANNASTDLHRTNYFSWGPSKLLPTLLWLDADRLEDMGLNMTQEKLDKQRDVVRNELRQTVENTPYGKAGEMVSKLMYPPTHPYYNGVIGTHEDLEAANVANVKDFFANYYVPSNATLVVAGDFQSAEIKPLIAGLFGTIDRGQDVTRKYTIPSEPIPARLAGVKRLTAIDKVQLPKVQFNYHSPRAYGEGDAEMRLLASILADGNSSRLYKRLVMDEKIASSVDASQQGFPLGSLFTIDVLAKPDADLDRIEKVVDEELARIIASGPTPDELTRNQASIELAQLASLQNIQAKADRLNEYEYYWHEPNSFKRDLDRYRSATPQSIQKWAREVLTPDARAIIRVLPEEPERTAGARDTRPAESSPKPFAPPAATTFTLPGGLPVILFERHDLPLVSLLLLSAPGGGLDTPGKEGLASLTASMLSEGAGDLDALAFGDAVRSLGASFGASADTETAAVRMTSLSRNIPKAAALFADAVRRPRFDATAWDRIKGLHLDDLREEADQPAVAAARVGSRFLFASGNPYAIPPTGTIHSVEPLSVSESMAMLTGRLLRPETSTLFIGGDITMEQAVAVFGPLFDGWKSTSPPPSLDKNFAFAPATGPRLVIINRPGAVQTVVRFVMPGVRYADPSRIKLSLLNTILGGSFTSRLNANLRENHGFTYGARSRLEMDPSTGSMTAGAAVVAESTGAALKEFYAEFDRIHAGDVTAEEATKARETLRNEVVRAFSGLGGMLGNAAILKASGLPLDTTAADLTTLSGVTAPELNAIGTSAIPLDKSILVLVGDKGVILGQIKDMNLPPPVFCDAQGNPVP